MTILSYKQTLSKVKHHVMNTGGACMHISCFPEFDIKKSNLNLELIKKTYLDSFQLYLLSLRTV